MLRHLLSILDAPVRRLTGDRIYLAYRLTHDEFVGHVPDGEHAPTWLRERGYDRQLLAAAKRHPETDAVDDGSFRRVDPDATRWQWHVHLFDDELYSHYELRPDPHRIDGETWLDVIERLREHYRPTHATEPGEGVTYVRGATDLDADLG